MTDNENSWFSIYVLIYIFFSQVFDNIESSYLQELDDITRKWNHILGYSIGQEAEFGLYKFTFLFSKRLWLIFYVSNSYTYYILR